MKLFVHIVGITITMMSMISCSGVSVRRDSSMIRSMIETEIGYEYDGDSVTVTTNSMEQTEYNDLGLIIENARYGDNGELLGKTGYKYDSDGKIIFEIERNLYERISGMIEYDYDRHGNPVRIRTYDGFDHLLKSTVMSYDGRGNILVGVTTNYETGKGMICSNQYGSGGKLTETLCYDLKGELLYGEMNQYLFGKLKTERAIGTGFHTNSVTINRYDMILRLVETSIYEGETFSSKTVYQYHKGEVVSETIYDGETDFLMKTTYAYGRDKQLTNLSVYYEPEYPSLSEVYIYDTDGSLIRFEEYGIGGLISAEEYDYDSEGRVTETRYYNDEDVMTGWESTVYDAYGNPVEITEYDESGIAESSILYEILYY